MPKNLFLLRTIGFSNLQERDARVSRVGKFINYGGKFIQVIYGASYPKIQEMFI
jgi:hypothetical protein